MTEETFIPAAEPEAIEPSSWAVIDLTGYVDGTYEPVVPTILARDDGKCLFYAGKVSSLYGESESCKSMIAQLAVVTEIAKGNRVSYIDYESDARAVVSRFIALGASGDDIVALVDYRRPDVPITDMEAMPDWLELLETQYSLVVIDGMTEAFATAGVSSNDNDEVTQWMRAVPKRIAEDTGASVILIDHVTKSNNGAGRFAIGAQSKLSTLTGTGYKVEPITIPAIGRRGTIKLSVTKDREATIRGYADGDGKASGDRGEVVAKIVIDSTEDPSRIKTEVLAPNSELLADVPEAADWRPTALMERVSRTLEEHPEGLSFNKIDENTVGGRARLLEAFNFLVQGGYVETVKSKHFSKEPFRAESREQGGTGSRFPSREGEPGEPGTTYRPTGSPVQRTTKEPPGTTKNHPADGMCSECGEGVPVEYQSRCQECLGEPPF